MSQPPHNDGATENTMMVEVVYAEAHRQWRWSVSLPDGATVADAVRASPIAQLRPAWSIETGAVGIFGKSVSPSTTISTGDRIELYRPLQCDPKEVRRQRAQRDR